jgi:hypothetical protein
MFQHAVRTLKLRLKSPLEKWIHSAGSKNFLGNKVVPAIKKALPVVNNALSVGTVASFVLPAVAPISGGVCTASRITGVFNGVVNRR